MSGARARRSKLCDCFEMDKYRYSVAIEGKREALYNANGVVHERP